ncbi:hypothetical protein TNCV_4796691 [Trichonephila clavipes]|nr:hypothetical protein TNCV_4796691 [Trichonephila clavipes]
MEQMHQLGTIDSSWSEITLLSRDVNASCLMLEPCAGIRLNFFSEKGSLRKLTLHPIAETSYPIDHCLNEDTLPPTSRANNTSNIVVSRQGAEDRVIDPVSCEVQLTTYIYNYLSDV